MGNEWSENCARRNIETTRREVDARIAAVAGRQEQLITVQQVCDAGLSRSSITRRRQAKRLFPVFPGVLALHPPPYTDRQRYRAAVMACGPGSHLAGWAAAHLLRLADSRPSLIEIVNPTGRGRSFAGVKVHRSSVTSADRITVAGILCTQATRTIVDLARSTDEDRLEDLLLAADSKGSLSRHRLEVHLEERRGQPGTRRLRDLTTDDPVETQSRNEQRMFKLCREFGVPLPVTQQRFDVEGETFYADFYWPKAGLIVEASSWRWHGGRSKADADADRGQLLSMTGKQVVYFTRDQIKHRRAECGRRLLALTSE